MGSYNHSSKTFDIVSVSSDFLREPQFQMDFVGRWYFHR